MITRVIWSTSRFVTSGLRGVLLRSLGRRLILLGRQPTIFGWPSFGTCNGNIRFGDRAMLGRHLQLSASPEAFIQFDHDCSLNQGSIIIAMFGIEIGSGTRIAEYVTIRDQNHRFDNPAIPVHHQGYSGGPIRIGSNCWIGRGAYIGPGVTLGDGVVVGANSVVITDMEDGAVCVGAPAKPIKRLGREKV